MNVNLKLVTVGIAAMIIFAGFAAFLVIAMNPVSAPIRVACVGDSITEGSGYPQKLKQLLGVDYTVGNFGVSGSTVSLDSNLPYMNQTKFQEAKNFDPDIVVIMLGTNDANPEISPNENNFETDYTKLITAFQQLEGQQLIWIVKSPPIFPNNSNYNNTYLENKIIPQTDAVAQRMDLPTINMYNALDSHPNYFMDGVHPDSNGATVIATQVYDTITLPNGSPNTALFAAGYSG